MARELDFQGLAAVGALAEARKAKSAAEKAEKQAAEAVKAILGDEREGRIGGVVVVEIKEVSRHDVDRTMLKEQFPTVAEAVDKVIAYDKIVLA